MPSTGKVLKVELNKGLLLRRRNSPFTPPTLRLMNGDLHNRADEQKVAAHVVRVVGANWLPAETMWK